MQSYRCPFSEQTMQSYSIPPWKCNGELRPLTDPPHLTRSWWSGGCPHAASPGPRTAETSCSHHLHRLAAPRSCALSRASLSRPTPGQDAGDSCVTP